MKKGTFLDEQCFGVHRAHAALLASVGAEPLPLDWDGANFKFEVFFRRLREEIAAMPDVLNTCTGKAALVCYKDILTLLGKQGCDHIQAFEAGKFVVSADDLRDEKTSPHLDTALNLARKLWRVLVRDRAKQLALDRLARVLLLFNYLYFVFYACEVRNLFT